MQPLSQLCAHPRAVVTPLNEHKPDSIANISTHPDSVSSTNYYSHSDLQSIPCTHVPPNGVCGSIPRAHHMPCKLFWDVLHGDCE